MRVILSRKGFDGTAGGCPSPIVDGRPVPLPIPTNQPSCLRYGDLNGNMAELVADLTRGRYDASSPCHLDPDIDCNLLSRQPGWRGAFGQIAASASHLHGKGVTTGDLFLFWGCYRAATRRGGAWRFNGPVRHMIYGWLQVGSVHRLGDDGSALAHAFPWLGDHPHVRPGWDGLNTIYLAADTLDVPGFTGALPGWGVLPHGFVLSAPGRNPSIWQAPDWLHPASGGCGMTYHPSPRWQEPELVATAPRGQEFVARIEKQHAFGVWLQAVFAAMVSHCAATRSNAGANMAARTA